MDRALLLQISGGAPQQFALIHIKNGAVSVGTIDTQICPIHDDRTVSARAYLGWVAAAFLRRARGYGIIAASGLQIFPQLDTT